MMMDFRLSLYLVCVSCALMKAALKLKRDFRFSKEHLELQRAFFSIEIVLDFYTISRSLIK